MSIGIVVDGQAESQALRALVKRIVVPKKQILNPVYADMQPRAAAGQIVRAAIPKLHILRSQGATRRIVLIDLEDQECCVLDFVDAVQAEFARKHYSDVQVVAKNCCFENWLIADLDALRSMPKRFQLTAAFERKVSPNRSDNIPRATTLLNTVCVGREYHKRTDSINICSKQDPLKIAANSRSFRRFLRVVGHATYGSQSKQPK